MKLNIGKKITGLEMTLNCEKNIACFQTLMFKGELQGCFRKKTGKEDV